MRASLQCLVRLACWSPGHCTRTGCADPRRLVHAIRARTSAQIETTQIVRPEPHRTPPADTESRTRNRRSGVAGPLRGTVHIRCYLGHPFTWRTPLGSDHEACRSSWLLTNVPAAWSRDDRAVDLGHRRRRE